MRSLGLTPFALATLILFLLKEFFDYVLRYMNFRYMKKFGLTVPNILEGTIDEATLRKMIAYETDNIRFGIVASSFSTLAMIVFVFGGLLDCFNSWIVSFRLPFIVSGLAFFLLLSYANTVISIPFSLYRTFKIENTYGFNTMTPALWCKDLCKSILLSTLIIGILVSVGLWIVESSPEWWWIWTWVFFLAFSLFMMYVSPYVIEPLFNRFSPIEDQVLVERIQAMLQKIGMTVKRVFRMDASKRSRHTNAYFSGIGRVKRIILYDTLLDTMTHDEVLAVLAHEAGHWKRKHILKMIAATEAIALVVMYVSFRVLRTDFLTDHFSIQQETFFAKLVLLGFIGGILSFPFIPVSNFVSRRFEREADRFACVLTERTDALISALIKLSKENLSNLHPHPLYAAIYYSHPPVEQRIRSIMQWSGDTKATL